MQNQNNKKKGYTIIETMIAVSLFIVVVMSGMGALLNANLLHQKSQSLRSIMDNLSFVMEEMSRNLRTGYNFDCFYGGRDIETQLDLYSSSYFRSCASGWAIAFEHSSGSTATLDDQWIYRIWFDGKLYKSTDGTTSWVQLTPDEVVLDTLTIFTSPNETRLSSFSVLGAEAPPVAGPPWSSGNRQQPFIVIRLVGRITYKNVVTPFSMQTSVSQRLIDI